MRFIDAVDALIETYNTIDIRIVAFDVNGRWQAILNIIRFKIDSMEEVKEQHKKIEKFGLISNEKFRAGVYAFPISSWPKIRSNFSKGVMEFPDSFIVDISKDDLNHEVSDSPQHEDLDEFNKDWSGFYLITRTPTLSHDQKVLTNQNNEVLKRSFKNIYDYLSAIFEVKISSINWNNCTNVISAPVFFKIEEVTFDEGIVTVNGKWCPNENVKLMLDIFQQDPNGQKGKLKDKIPIPIESASKSRVIEPFTITTPFTNVSHKDAFEIVPTCKNILLQHYGGWVEYKLQKKETIRDPLISVFEKFITLKELKEMLIDIKSKDTTDPKIIFERGVYWLLTILGFQTVWLGKGFERLEKKPHVVLDMIASYRNYLLLVNATSGILDSKDVSGQILTRDEISTEISDKNIQIYPILFSPRSANELRKTIGEGDVRLIGKDDLEYIFNLIGQQRIDLARTHILTKPWVAPSVVSLSL
jgi:hypothetical protein